MTDLTSVPSHSPSVVSRKTGNEYVLIPVTNNIADMNSVYTLNETCAFIWEQIDGKKNVNQIVLELIKEFDTDKETAEKDVTGFLQEMVNYLIIK